MLFLSENSTPKCLLLCVFSYFSRCSGLFSSTLWTVASLSFCPWDFPSKNTGVDCHAFPPRSLDPGIKPAFLVLRGRFYLLSHQESPTPFYTLLIIYGWSGMIIQALIILSWFLPPLSLHPDFCGGSREPAYLSVHCIAQNIPNQWTLGSLLPDLFFPLTSP